MTKQKPFTLLWMIINNIIMAVLQIYETTNNSDY